MTTSEKTLSNSKTLALMRACVKQNIPVLLRGETGTGKTTMVRELATAEQKELTRINLTGQTTREDLIGKYILKDGNLAWQDGALLAALKRESSWLLLDEINAALPEVLFLLQSLLETRDQLGSLLLVEKDGEAITPHPDCRIFATCNPSEYDGVKDFNMATLSRFVVIDVEPLSYGAEEQLLLDRYNSKIARALVTGADQARKKKREGETGVFVSTRDLELAARLHAYGVSAQDAVNTAIISKCQNDNDKAVIAKCFDVKITSESGKGIIEELEELKKENEKLKTEAKSATKLLEAFEKMTGKESPLREEERQKKEKEKYAKKKLEKGDYFEVTDKESNYFGCRGWAVSLYQTSDIISTWELDEPTEKIKSLATQSDTHGKQNGVPPHSEKPYYTGETIRKGKYILLPPKETKPKAEEAAPKKKRSKKASSTPANWAKEGDKIKRSDGLIGWVISVNSSGLVTTIERDDKAGWKLRKEQRKHKGTGWNCAIEPSEYEIIEKAEEELPF